MNFKIIASSNNEKQLEFISWRQIFTKFRAREQLADYTTI
jgi:hypothetical protein